MALQEIPVDNSPNVTFQITLDGNNLAIDIKWNDTDLAWYANFKGLSFDLDLEGIRLASGIDLFKPFAIIELGQLWVIDLDEELLDPDFDGFGDRYKLIYVPKGESF